METSKENLGSIEIPTDSETNTEAENTETEKGAQTDQPEETAESEEKTETDQTAETEEPAEKTETDQAEDTEETKETETITQAPEIEGNVNSLEGQEKTESTVKTVPSPESEKASSGNWGTVVLIILLIAMYLSGFRGNRYVEAAFKGIRPAVIALIAVPFINMLKRLPWYFMLLAVAVSGVICYAGVSPIWFILAGALAGVVLTWYEKPRPDGKGGAE